MFKTLKYKQAEKSLSVKALIGLSFFLIATTSGAQDKEISLKLESLQKIQPAEDGVDELYFTITEFPYKTKAVHYQIPNFPAHWLSSHLNEVKDVTLWQKTLKQCEPTEVLLSLVEEDLPPWNPNDLLGSVKLRISCDKGKIVENWSIPNPAITAAVANSTHAFSFNGEKMQYQATFKFEKVNARNVVKKPIPAKQKAKVAVPATR